MNVGECPKNSEDGFIARVGAVGGLCIVYYAFQSMGSWMDVTPYILDSQH